MKILIVEDNLNVLKLVEHAFKRKLRNVEVHICSQPNEALFDKISQEQYDLIILDLIMPLFSGTEILIRLKKEPLTKDINVIVLTAKTLEKDLVKHMEYGAVDYIKKPFEVKELLARVKRFL